MGKALFMMLGPQLRFETNASQKPFGYMVIELIFSVIGERLPLLISYIN
jgi:hypothetical protein